MHRHRSLKLKQRPIIRISIFQNDAIGSLRRELEEISNQNKQLLMEQQILREKDHQHQQFLVQLKVFFVLMLFHIILKYILEGIKNNVGKRFQPRVHKIERLDSTTV